MCYHAGMKKKLQLKLTIRLYSDDDERCFGPGIAVLLHRVEEHHSLRAAAASMEMAYSKAWRIVRTAEAVFGCKLLEMCIRDSISSVSNLVAGAPRCTCWTEEILED